MSEVERQPGVYDAWALQEAANCGPFWRQLMDAEAERDHLLDALTEVERDRDHWKANHDAQVARKRQLHDFNDENRARAEAAEAECVRLREERDAAETVWVVVDRAGKRRGMPQVTVAAAATLARLRNDDDQAGAPFHVVTAALVLAALSSDETPE